MNYINIIINIFDRITLFFDQHVGLILFLTLAAIIWSSYETRELRKWQIKNVQMSIINLQTNIKIAQQKSLNEGNPVSPYVTNNFGETIRKIYEEGKLDLKDIYSLPDRNTYWHKIIKKFIGSKNV